MNIRPPLLAASRPPLPHHRQHPPQRAFTPRPPPSQETLHAAPAALRDLAILAVDDDPDMLELTGMVFDAYGARVTGVLSAESALAALREMPMEAPYGLLLSDIGLPGMDGYEFLENVRHRLNIAPHRLPAIAVTAYARAEDRAMALNAGFQAHLPKPYDADQLVATALRLLS